MFLEKKSEHNVLEEVSSMILQDNAILYATYHYDNNFRSGSINLLRNEQIIKIAETTGTFLIKKIDNIIYSANSNDICIDKNVIKTNHMNMSMDIYDNYVIVSQENGFVTLYNTSLDLIDRYKVCEHIIWICKIRKNKIYAGCDCGRFVVIEIQSKNIIKTDVRESGVTSIHFSDDRVFVGSYDEYVQVYCEQNLCMLYKKKIGGGVWNIIDIDGYFGIACMYDGVKICTKEFKVIQHIKTNDLVYGIDYCNNKLVYSEFYEKKYLYTKEKAKINRYKILFLCLSIFFLWIIF